MAAETKPRKFNVDIRIEGANGGGEKHSHHATTTSRRPATEKRFRRDAGVATGRGLRPVHLSRPPVPPACVRRLSASLTMLLPHLK
jgi:hypothetical protein